MSEQPGAPADDPYGGRAPTSHERFAGRPWDASYDDGPAPWDIGGPQPTIARVASEGGFTGAVLDAGCGSGENALHLAALGLKVVGVDVAPTALARARAKAVERGLTRALTPVRIPSAAATSRPPSTPTPDGRSYPSNRTGSTRDSTATPAHRPGSRRSSGRDQSAAGCRVRT